MKLYFLLFIIFFATDTNAQQATSFWTLSRPEKWWVCTHPFVANKARKITAEARSTTVEMLKDSLLDADAEGGRVDAFRHSYWMARMAQTFCWRKAIRLGNAHEKGNYLKFKKGMKDEEAVLADSASNEMDLFNNKVGARIGCQNPELKSVEIKRLLVQKIRNNEMLIISKNQDRIPLDCSGKIIDVKNYYGIWNIPKCLVPSGF